MTFPMVPGARLVLAVLLVASAPPPDSSTRTGTVPDIDGSVCATVKIGGESCVAESLRVTRAPQGDWSAMVQGVWVPIPALRMSCVSAILLNEPENPPLSVHRVQSQGVPTRRATWSRLKTLYHRPPLGMESTRFPEDVF